LGADLRLPRRDIFDFLALLILDVGKPNAAQVSGVSANALEPVDVTTSAAISTRSRKS
jgi:hypothetical protein